MAAIEKVLVAHDQIIHCHITGSVAKKRIMPLLQKRAGVENIVEVDVPSLLRELSAPSRPNPSLTRVDFCWENTPAKATRLLRAECGVFSHVANAHIFEDKWALALLQDTVPPESDCPLLATHCLRGRSAVVKWCARRWGGVGGDTGDDLWVLKDAESNGAGGIWVLSRHRWRDLCGVTNALSPTHTVRSNPLSLAIAATAAASATSPGLPSSPLHEGHRYVAQQYVASPRAPPFARAKAVEDRGSGLRLWRGRKFHIRAYAVLTGDLGVFLQRRAFLHVANKPFVGGKGAESDDEVHITNCCANSDNEQRFAGEIVINDLGDPNPFPDLENCNEEGGIDDEDADVVARVAQSSKPTQQKEESVASPQPASSPSHPHSFARAFADMRTILASLVGGAAPFLEAQRSPHDVEYMGVDFMVDSAGRAWLLECNCPPSQDTATGLPHAEALHDAVIGDLIDAFVLPVVTSNRRSRQREKKSSSPAPPGSDSFPPPSVVVASDDGDEIDDEAQRGSSRPLQGTGWVECRAPSLVPFEPAAKTTGNSLRWKLFEAKALRRRAAALSLLEERS